MQKDEDYNRMNLETEDEDNPDIFRITRKKLYLVFLFLALTNLILHFVCKISYKLLF